MSTIPQRFDIRNVIKIEFDREKIERDGEYYYEDLVEYLDTNFEKQGFIRDKSLNELVYYNDERNSFFKQVACYGYIADEPAVFDNLKSWRISEFRDNNSDNPVMIENVLETLAKHGGRPYWQR